MGIEMLFHDYAFKTDEYQCRWRCIRSYTFENMELFYRKQLSIQSVLIRFKKTFGITPQTIKKRTDRSICRRKLLAIYLLAKYSKADFSIIAETMHVEEKMVERLYRDKRYEKSFREATKRFFRQFEEDFITMRRCQLAMAERLTLMSETKG